MLEPPQAASLQSLLTSAALACFLTQEPDHGQGAKIQLLDLPGIIEGAKDGKGRGKQVRPKAMHNAKQCCQTFPWTCCKMSQVDRPHYRYILFFVFQAPMRRPRVVDFLLIFAD